MTLVKCSADTIVNADDVATIEWDRGSSYTSLVITMKSGKVVRIKHQPNCLDGTDCYLIEAKLIDATRVPQSG